MTFHQCVVRVRTQDDAIVVVCTICSPGWEKAMPFDPSPESLVEAALEHNREILEEAYG